MEKVLGGSDKVIIEQGQNGPGVVPYLPLPEIQKRAARQHTTAKEQPNEPWTHILLIVLAILAFLGLNSFFVVNERDQAIVLRFGEIKRVETEPGLYFKLPFTMFDLDTVQIVEDRLAAV